jgi:hypothetical protein
MVISIDPETGAVSRVTVQPPNDPDSDYDEAVLYSEWNPALAEIARQESAPQPGPLLDAETVARLLDDIE